MIAMRVIGLPPVSVHGAAAVGAVAVASGATLGGTGTVGGATSVTGTLAPGAVGAAGTLAFADNLALQSGAALAFDIAGTVRGTSYDGVDFASGKTVAYNGALTLNITSLLAAGTYDLFNLGAAATGDLASVSLSGGLYTGTFTETSAGSGVWTATLSDGEQATFTTATGDFVVAAVPEPAPWTLFALGMGGTLIAFRRFRPVREGGTAWRV